MKRKHASLFDTGVFSSRGQLEKFVLRERLTHNLSVLEIGEMAGVDRKVVYRILERHRKRRRKLLMRELYKRLGIERRGRSV